MIKYKEIKNTILLLEKYPNTIAWEDFGDKGNRCSGCYSDGLIEAQNLGSVKLIMPKNSELHISLSKSISSLLGNQWITYDWLIKSLSRVLALGSYEVFVKLVRFSIIIKNGRKNP